MKIHSIHNLQEGSVRLRNNISFGSPPMITLQDHTPVHLSKVLSLLSELLPPGADSRHIFSLLIREETGSEKKDLLISKNL